MIQTRVVKKRKTSAGSQARQADLRRAKHVPLADHRKGWLSRPPEAPKAYAITARPINSAMDITVEHVMSRVFLSCTDRVWGVPAGAFPEGLVTSSRVILRFRRFDPTTD